jgi:hypothetical protein
MRDPSLSQLSSNPSSYGLANRYSHLSYPMLIYRGMEHLTQRLTLLIGPTILTKMSTFAKVMIFVFFLIYKIGELLCGVITKSIVGNSAGGLVHIIWKDVGSQACKTFLSNVQLLVNNWLYNHGFSVGVQDIIAKSNTISSINDTLLDCKTNVSKILHTAQMGKLKS